MADGSWNYTDAGTGACPRLPVPEALAYGKFGAERPARQGRASVRARGVMLIVVSVPPYPLQTSHSAT